VRDEWTILFLFDQNLLIIGVLLKIQNYDSDMEHESKDIKQNLIYVHK